MVRRFWLPLCLVLGMLAVNIVPAHAATRVWSVSYGNGYTSNAPNVWSNRVPIWDTGGDPHLRFERDGNLRDLSPAFLGCPGTVCWQTGTSGIPTPAHLVWQGDGNVVIYDNGGTARWSTHTDCASCLNFMQMILWSNGCLIVYAYITNWERQWSASSNPACLVLYP